jgi:hypothetical protein
MMIKGIGLTCWSKVEVTSQLTVCQYVLVSGTLVGLVTRYYFLSECYLKFAVLFLWGTLSDERTSLQFASGCMEHGAIQLEGTMFLRKAGGKDIKPTLLHSQIVSELNMKYRCIFIFQDRPKACQHIFFGTLLCC